MATSKAAKPVTFTTAVSAFGKNTGIVVPPDVLDQLGAGKRPAVTVDLNGYAYPTTLGSMGGQSLISVSAAVRKDTGLEAGDTVTVTVALATGPRAVDVPADFAAALEVSGTRAFFDGLSNSVQRYHVDNVNGAKTDDTRQRRIKKAVDLFRNGKSR